MITMLILISLAKIFKKRSKKIALLLSAFQSILSQFQKAGALIVLQLLISNNIVNAQCAEHALQYGGSNYVNAGVNTSLEMDTALTMEAWIYPAGPGIIMNREGEYEVARFADGTIQYAISQSATITWLWVNTGYVAPLNSWTHLAVTFSSATGSVKVYANGVQIFSSSSVSGNITDQNFASSMDELRIGARQGFIQYFQGVVDEARIWNASLTQSTIQSWMNHPITSVHPSFSNLKGYWKFDEGTGGNTADASGNGNTGTLVNSPTWVSSTAPIECTFLPVELVNFDATPLDHKVKLNWTTASEINSKYFTVEKSKDAIDWEKVMQVNAGGNSISTLSYSVVDDHPYGGTSYYRLKQTDDDGAFTYSEVRVVEMNSKQITLNIFPNPFHSTSTIRISHDIQSGVLLIYDNIGREVQQTGNINSTSITIDGNGMKDGIYFFVLKENEEIIGTGKMVIE